MLFLKPFSEKKIFNLQGKVLFFSPKNWLGGIAQLLGGSFYQIRVDLGGWRFCRLGGSPPDTDVCFRSICYNVGLTNVKAILIFNGLAYQIVIMTV